MNIISDIQNFIIEHRDVIISLLIGFFVSLFFYCKSVKCKKPVYIVKTIKLIEPKVKQVSAISISYLDNKIEKLSASKIALWNEGKETISSKDVAKNEKIKIMINPQYEILECNILYQKKKANSFSVRLSRNQKEAYINFDYFDYKEGVVIQLLHTGNSSEDISIIGSIKSVNYIKRKGFQKKQGKSSIITYISKKIFKITKVITSLVAFKYISFFFMAVLLLLLFYSFFIDANTLKILLSLGNETTDKYFMQFLILLGAISYYSIGYQNNSNSIPKGFDIFNEEFLEDTKEGAM